MDNLYEILEVSQNASNEVIQKAYKVLAKRYHPDVAKDKIEAERMIKRINHAYSVLSDKQKRYEYDIQLKSQQPILENNVYNKYESKYQYEQPEKTINLDNRVVVGIIIVAVILFIFACASLFGTIGDILNENDLQNVKDIHSHSSKYVIEDIAKYFVNFDYESISNNITNPEIFKQQEVEIIKENMEMYNRILPNISLEVTQIQANDNIAELTVNISRNDVEGIYIQYYFARSLGNNFTPEKERRLLLQCIEKESNKVSIKDKYIAKKIDNQWKIELSNINIINLIGMSISKYADIFQIIN